jgi:hypothetical protein
MQIDSVQTSGEGGVIVPVVFSSCAIRTHHGQIVHFRLLVSFERKRIGGRLSTASIGSTVRECRRLLPS